jgi:enoyl-CoA hydratase/carnithine racemase
LNRPEARNALSPPMVRALHVALVHAADEPDVTGVVLTGTGEAFSAGADLKEFLAARPPLDQALERRGLGALMMLIDGYRKPLVAAVNGDALGAGFGLVAACHLAVAVEAARFGLPGVRLGIMPMTIMPAVSKSLPRKLGLELMLTGRLMSSVEAADQGVVNRIVAPGELERAAASLARSAATAP